MITTRGSSRRIRSKNFLIGGGRTPPTISTSFRLSFCRTAKRNMCPVFLIVRTQRKCLRPRLLPRGSLFSKEKSLINCHSVTYENHPTAWEPTRKTFKKRAKKLLTERIRFVIVPLHTAT